jgi:hypothetical protein
MFFYWFWYHESIVIKPGTYISDVPVFRKMVQDGLKMKKKAYSEWWHQTTWITLQSKHKKISTTGIERWEGTLFQRVLLLGLARQPV